MPVAWTDEFLQQMRQTADPLADDTISALFAQHGITAVNSLWNDLVANDELPPASSPPVIQAYFARSAEFPPWADFKLIAQGETFFEQRGVLCLGTLLGGSLPECYVLTDEADVLGTTRQLINKAHRRVFETTQLVVAVMKVGGLGRAGDGVRAAQKVRLMHAAIRHLILHTSGKQTLAGPQKTLPEAVRQMPEWDTARQGLPINQEQMAYTLLTFSYVMLRAFKDLNIPVSADERAAYLHCWNVVGYIMGVKESLLARTFEDAGGLFSLVKERRMGESVAGKAMAQALLQCTHEIIQQDSDGLFPPWILRNFPVVLMHLLLEQRTVALLDIGRLGFGEKMLLGVLRGLARIFEWGYQKIVSRLGIRFGELILIHLTKLPPSGHRILFKIPDQLRTAWKMK